MKRSNILKAWKSSVLAILLMLALGVGVTYGVVSNEALIALLPLVLALFTDPMNESKCNHKEDTE